eukprot:3688764-Pleurochrysis_carterae.AAC.1
MRGRSPPRLVRATTGAVGRGCGVGSVVATLARSPPPSGPCPPRGRPSGGRQCCGGRGPASSPPSLGAPG